MSSLLGDRIYSIHCRASYVAPGPGGFEERDALILFFILSWCNSSYSSFRPSAIHPNSSNRPCFKKVSGAKKLIDSAPPRYSDDLCRLFCTVWILRLWLGMTNCSCMVPVLWPFYTHTVNKVPQFEYILNNEPNQTFVKVFCVFLCVFLRGGGCCGF